MMAVAKVIDQHGEEASFLWLLRSRAVRQPHYSLSDLAELDSRVEAHLDALRTAGETGWEICRHALTREEPGEVFAATVLALERDDGTALDSIVDICARSSDSFPAAASALGWVSTDCARRWTTRMLDAQSARHRWLGIVGSAMHREDLASALVTLARDRDHDVRMRALRAAGELKRHDVLPMLRHAYETERGATRFWAAWSRILLGDRGAAEDLLAFAHPPTPFAERAIQLALRAMPLAESAAWLKRVAKDVAVRRNALIGCGAAGDPAYVPALISQMGLPELARVSGEAFSAITGVDLAYEDLAGDQPDDFEAGPTEDPSDENVALDQDEDLPWPDQARVKAWWQANGPSFTPGQRYLCGRPIDEENCRRVLRTGYQRQRSAAAYELALMSRDEPLFEWRAPGFRQQELLGLRRA